MPITCAVFRAHALAHISLTRNRVLTTYHLRINIVISSLSIMPTPPFSSLYSFYEPARRKPQRYPHQHDEPSELPATRRSSGRIPVASRESPRNQLKSSHKIVGISRASDRNSLPAAGVIVKLMDGETFAADFGMDNFFALHGGHCVVCLGEWQTGQTVLRSQNCPHIYHSSCIMSWMKKSNECPSCRERFLLNGRPSMVTSLSEVVSGGSRHEDDAGLEVETGLDENTSSEGNEIDSDLIALQQQRALVESRLDFGVSDVRDGVVCIGSCSYPLTFFRLNLFQTVSEADSTLLAVTFKSPALRVSLQATPCLLCSERWIPEAILAQSSNPMCPHYFHRDCIVDHLMHTSSDCPRCRRTFADTDGAYCRPTTRSASERSPS